MAHNKQLKVVLRGLPTDFNQEELMSELHTFGFQPNHISLLRNRKTNTNMPLFLLEPRQANSNGNILCNWAVGSALDILAPDTPTHFNSRHSNAILDIGFAVNLSHTEVFTINTLSSDHNPVIFDFVTNNALPPILRTLKTTNWIKFQEIISHTIPGNPRIDDLDLAVQNFTSNISNAISASTSTRLITTPHLRLPENIRELIRAKNRFRKLWNETRYPPYKREVNALIRQIRKEIQEHKNRTWKDFFNFKP
ncbi:putative RNA-directed DNA polymerase from transposon X-element [Trichonephila clavipes]|nr:putative RNA-directed DNA polymerase from transposon X-element [Trichonephila clavipes]